MLRLEKNKIIHIVGIGGIGMSGLAELLYRNGFTVQGSDQADNHNVRRLQEMGIKVYHGHASHNIDGSDYIIHSTAIKHDNPEYMTAKERKIPLITRADLLAEMTCNQDMIAISGTHGKTTTTTMLGNLLTTLGQKPTVICGGIMNHVGSNVSVGNPNEWLVVEADESDGTFCRLTPTISIITNMDAEHLDYYKTADAMFAAYERFIENTRFHGHIIICADIANIETYLHKFAHRRAITTYGTSDQADIQILNIRSDQGGSYFDLQEKNSRLWRDIRLHVTGIHNILNATAAIICAQQRGFNMTSIQQALSNYQGVQRRFTTVGIHNGIRIIDDYAHHPREIQATIQAARQLLSGTEGRLWVVHQPHRYSRLQALFQDYLSCFEGSDHLSLMDVCGAGETAEAGYKTSTLRTALQEQGQNSLYVTHIKELKELVTQNMKAGDILLFMGAGDITHHAAALNAELATINNPTHV